MVVSSRKQQNVNRAVATLQGEGLSVTGIVCHVGKAEDREKLITTVSRQNMGAGPRHGRREARQPVPSCLVSRTALVRYNPC